MFDDKLIDFLSKEENINFLLEIEPLIPKVKGYIFKKILGIFITEYINPKLWPGYETKMINDDYLLIDNKSIDDINTYNNLKYFYISIYGGIGEQNYYGVIGNPNKFNEHLQSLDNLINKLKTKGMKGSWKHWLDWKYFDKDRKELLLLSNPEEIAEFLKQWAENFWEFANDIKESLKN